MMPGAESSNITFSGYFGRIDTRVLPCIMGAIVDLAQRRQNRYISRHFCGREHRMAVRCNGISGEARPEL
jgi:hypothetical protein